MSTTTDSRISHRALLDLFIAITAAFAAGIFELFNVLNCEVEGMSNMGSALLVAQGLALATFVTFKFAFLFRRTQNPLQSESTAFPGLPLAQEEVQNRTVASHLTVQSRPSDGVHSGSYARWGVFGGVVRAAVYLTILIVGLLVRFKHYFVSPELLTDGGRRASGVSASSSRFRLFGESTLRATSCRLSSWCSSPGSSSARRFLLKVLLFAITSSSESLLRE